MIKNISIYICAIALSGCIAFPMSLMPSVSGKILDYKTNEPISEANVYFESYQEIETTTDKSGYFELTPKKEWRPLCIMGVAVDYPHYPSSLVVSKEGHQIVVPSELVDQLISGKVKEIHVNIKAGPNQ